MKCGTRNMILAALLLAGWILFPVEAFIPNKFLSYIAAGLDLNFVSAVTHNDMTRSAILHVAADFLKDNPYNDESQQRINSLGLDFDENDLITAYRGEKNRHVTKQFQAAIKEIEKANSKVDTGSENTRASAHFHSEEFQSAQNRLIEMREMIVASINGKDYTNAREETGRMLHTLQDFYSHSNWIEMGNIEPYSVLGQPGKRPERIASPETSTCRDCSERETVSLHIFYNIVLHQSAEFHYSCMNNIRSNIQESRILTSGYHANQVNDEGLLLVKPSGKCSHGGYADPSADFHAKGGINKDSPYEDWSPHSSQHFEAAMVAEQATVNLLNEIRDEVGNDELFGAYLNLFVQIFASIAYVIDTTGSMGDELPEIQATIPTLRVGLEQYEESLGNNAQIKYILVPFNDPDPGYIFETEDINTFLNEIALLHASGGGDYHEPSIGALIRAIEASEEGSPIFLFTDAPASDSHRLAEAQALITEKSVTVTFAIPTSFIGKRSLNDDEEQNTQFKEKRQIDDTYYVLAAFSGGQVLNIQTSELSELGELVSFSADISRVTILRKSEHVLISIPYAFPVDSSIEKLFISINGQGFNINITTPEGYLASNLTLEEYTVALQSSSSFIATINITDSSLWGVWQISVPRNYYYSITVSATSDLSFLSDLFKSDPFNSYGFSTVVGKPLSGKPMIAVFQTNDLSVPLTVESIKLVDSSGFMLQTVDDLLVLDDNYTFVTNLIPPEMQFHWQIEGRDENGNNFTRITDIAIEVSDIDLTLGDGETGYYVLRPGSNTSVPILLYNSGQGGYFMLIIDVPTTNISALIESSITIGENSTASFVVWLSVSADATDELASTFTVVAQSTVDGSNNFITFKSAVTTQPPPEFSENDYAEKRRFLLHPVIQGSEGSEGCDPSYAMQIHNEIMMNLSSTLNELLGEQNN